MTTEILRSMLYKGADLIRDVEFVIFDEVHYVNDAEVSAHVHLHNCKQLSHSTARCRLGRGYHHASRSCQHHSALCDSAKHKRIRRLDRVRIFLVTSLVSSTLCRRTKKKDIYVISTPQRPVPLEHYLYAGRDIHKIVDKTGNFLGQGYAGFD